MLVNLVMFKFVVAHITAVSKLNSWYCKLHQQVVLYVKVVQIVLTEANVGKSFARANM